MNIKNIIKEGNRISAQYEINGKFYGDIVVNIKDRKIESNSHPDHEYSAYHAKKRLLQLANAKEPIPKEAVEEWY